MLFGILVYSLIGSALTGRGVRRGGEGTIKAGQTFNATSSFNKFWNTKLLSKWT